MSREALRYSTPTGHPGFTATSSGAQVTQYATLAALEAVATGVLVKFDEPEGSDKPIRVNLTMAAEGNDGNTYGEDVYLVVPYSMDEESGFRLQKLGSVAYTLGPVDVAHGARGESDTMKWPKAAAFTSSGLEEALTGGALEVKAFPSGTGGAANVAGVCVYDVGNAVGVWRVPNKGASATAAHPLHERWA